MATFVSLVTCHHCPVVSSRHGLVYRDSLSALSRNLRVPGCPRRPPRPHLKGSHQKDPHVQDLYVYNKHCRLTRTDLPESIALARSKPSGSMRHLVVSHLRKLLMISSAHRPCGPSQRPRELQLPV